MFMEEQVGNKWCSGIAGENDKTHKWLPHGVCQLLGLLKSTEQRLICCTITPVVPTIVTLIFRMSAPKGLDPAKIFVKRHHLHKDTPSRSKPTPLSLGHRSILGNTATSQPGNSGPFVPWGRTSWHPWRSCPGSFPIEAGNQMDSGPQCGPPLTRMVKSNKGD